MASLDPIEVKLEASDLIKALEAQQSEAEFRAHVNYRLDALEARLKMLGIPDAT